LICVSGFSNSLFISSIIFRASSEYANFLYSFNSIFHLFFLFIIEIDIPNRKLNVGLSDAEIKDRLKKVEIPERKLTPLLESYREKFTGVNCYGK
jgi:hypothetical protein